MPLPTVTSKSGDKYAVNSPQGKMIWNAAKNRAAESAAASNSFKPEGSAMSAGFIVLDASLQKISTNVESITRLLVMDAEKDARGDALRSADVTQAGGGPAPIPDEDGGYRAGGGDDKNIISAAKKASDDVFLKGMLDAEPSVPKWKIYAAYYAVVLFGRWSIIPNEDNI